MAIKHCNNKACNSRFSAPGYMANKSTGNKSYHLLFCKKRPNAQVLFHWEPIVTNQPPKENSAFHPFGVGKWVPASAGKAKAGMVHYVSGWTRGMQVKLWDALRTRAIPERLIKGVFTTRRYTNPRLPLPLPMSCRLQTVQRQRTFCHRLFILLSVQLGPALFFSLRMNVLTLMLDNHKMIGMRSVDYTRYKLKYKFQLLWRGFAVETLTRLNSRDVS